VIEPGRTGRFDVFADGELVAERQGGFLGRIFRAGLPREEDVLAALRRRGAGG